MQREIKAYRALLHAITEVGQVSKGNPEASLAAVAMARMLGRWRDAIGLRVIDPDMGALALDEIERIVLAQQKEEAGS